MIGRRCLKKCKWRLCNLIPATSTAQLHIKLGEVWRKEKHENKTRVINFVAFSTRSYGAQVCAVCILLLLRRTVMPLFLASFIFGDKDSRTIYTGCPRRNVPDFGRMSLKLKYTDIPQNTYIQSWTVTEIMAKEVWKYNSCYTLIDYQIHIKTGRNMWFL